MKIKKLYIVFAFIAAFGTIHVEQTAAQNVVTLKTVGNGEKVRLAIGKKSKIVTLEGSSVGDFTAGGDAPHRYTILLSVRKDDAFYVVAKFISGAAISDRNAPCGGDRPATLMLIKTDRNLKVEDIRTEIFDSCIYNGAGRYPKGKMRITSRRVSIPFDEGNKKYALVFDANEAEKGLQLIDR